MQSKNQRIRFQPIELNVNFLSACSQNPTNSFKYNNPCWNFAVETFVLGQNLCEHTSFILGYTWSSKTSWSTKEHVTMKDHVTTKLQQIINRDRAELWKLILPRSERVVIPWRAGSPFRALPFLLRDFTARTWSNYTTRERRLAI